MDVDPHYWTFSTRAESQRIAEALRATRAWVPVSSTIIRGSDPGALSARRLVTPQHRAGSRQQCAQILRGRLDVAGLRSRWACKVTARGWD
jgi:hypothetical protein